MSDLWRERADDLNICFVFVLKRKKGRRRRRRRRERLYMWVQLSFVHIYLKRGCRKDDKKWVDLSKVLPKGAGKNKLKRGGFTTD